MRFKSQVVVTLLTFFLTAIFPSLLWAESPGEIIVAAIDKSMKIFCRPSPQDIGGKSERKQKLWEILAPIFDFEEISRRALGRNWENHTTEERKEFSRVFTSILKNTYLYKSGSCANEKVIYLRENRQGNRSKVQTNLITTEGKKIAVDYSMHKIGDTWKIYDLAIEGVSVVGNYRSQFNSILNKSSFAELLQKLKEKEKEFDQI